MGTPGRDVLRGTAGPDVICGNGGNDFLIGLGGNDVLRGGSGHDVLLGGFGDDQLSGGPDDDLLVDRVGTNTLDGGSGAADRCVGLRDTTFIDCESVLPPPLPTGGAAAPAPDPAATAPSSATDPAGPHFVESASSATTNGGDVVVSFEEAGLAPNSTVEIEVTVSRTTEFDCRDTSSGVTILSASSTASASEGSTYTADGAGVVTATRTLTASPGTIDIQLPGYDCQATDSLEVTLHDRTNDTTLSFAG